MADAEAAVRFYPLHPAPSFFIFIFTPSVVLVPHFIIGYPHPTMVLSLLRSPSALGLSSWFKSLHLLNHYP
jgi:hypothetical protein